MSDFDLAIDTIVSDSMLSTGCKPSVMAARDGIARAFSVGQQPKRFVQTTRWSEQEDQFLRDHISYYSLEEIARLMGRSLNALHIRIIRTGVPPASRQPGWMTGNQVSKLLSVDGHSITGWIDRGILPARELPTARKYRVVKFEDLKQWLVRPENWPYFDSEKIKSEYLRSLVRKAKIRWGDEWWTTRQMADYHHCDIHIISKSVLHGVIPALQCKDIGGRGRATWAYWFIRKSVAIVWKVPSYSDPKYRWTDRSDAFLISAHNRGLTYAEIGRMMKWPEKRVIYRRLKLMKEAASADHQD